MGMRFRRSVRIAPGVRINVGKRGASLSVGPRGATTTFSSRGIYQNVGIPGTGLSFRERIDRPAARPQRAAASRSAAPAERVEIELALQDDGSVEFRAPGGGPLPPALVKRARQQNPEQIREWLAQMCERWNSGIDEILNVHLATPPGPAPFVAPLFTEEPPVRPRPRPIRWYHALVPGKRDELARDNRRGASAYEEATAEWTRTGEVFELGVAAARELHARAQSGDAEAIAALLDERLSAMRWPRETTASYEVEDGGRAVLLDVDLPEIEDLPDEEASVAARGVKINVKKRSDTRRRREYAQHIHAVAFRLVGEVMAISPAVHRLVFSGYSQRPDPATGAIRDEYLISAVVDRESWIAIDFGNLHALDLPAAFERFQLRRRMTKSGILRPVEPFTTENARWR